MDKKLALIFEYNKAPESLKAVAKSHRDNSAMLQKKQAQLKALSDEVALLKNSYEESGKAFAAELNAWQPTGA